MAFDQQKYVSEYNKQNIKYRKINFNEKNQKDRIIKEWIDSREESVSSYLKRLAYDDMIKQQK